MEIQLSQNRQPKKIYLAPESLEAISLYAKRNSTTFSSAIETLALMAIKDSFHMGILEWIRQGVRREMARQHNRFAKLFAFNAMESSTAKETVSAVFIWTLQERYRDYVDQLRPGEKPTHQGFQDFMRLKKDSLEAEILMAEIKRRLAGYRTRAVKNLRSPMAEYREILDEMDTYLNNASEQIHWVTENGKTDD